MPIDTMEDRMRCARVRSGLACSALAQHIGIHPDAYPLLEKKADRIHPFHLLRFCRAVDVDLSWIIYGSSPPPLVPLSGSTIGERIREYRLSTGLSARQFGYRMLGAKRNTSVSAWESGATIPELRSLMMIANAFGVSVVSFFPPDSCSMV